MRWLRAIAPALLGAVLLGSCAGAEPSGVPTASASVTSHAGVPRQSRSPAGPAQVPPTPSPSPTSAARPSPTATAGRSSWATGTPTVTPTLGPSPTTAPASPTGPQVGHSAWVSVSVATLWRSPSSPRAVDQPALRNPAAIRQWLSAMTLDDRRGLDGRADTQALLGERVLVTARSGAWVKVVVPDQPTPLDSRGYPGWVPAAQLTGTAPAAVALSATIVTKTAWLRTDDPAASAVVEVSYGTRLPRVGVSGNWVRVSTPTGRVLRVAASQVSVTSPGVPALPAGGSALVASAEIFTGLPYLWAGTSGFGLDCSGLTSLVHRVHGVIIPRDADAQAARGTPVSAGALRPGDLLFYATNGYVHHVSMYAGGGLMIQSPHTGGSVETIPMSTVDYAREFAGARRYLG